jgi:site-specific DNA-methyltransferase (adenine-specific)
MDRFPKETFELIYLDPPFFTQTQQALRTRDGSAEFKFQDLWASHEEYAQFLIERLMKLRELLSPTGSLFFHCDKHAVHIARLVLDEIFGAEMFQSEIIWSYRRWSNSRRGLLPAHQNILFYSKCENFKFNLKLTDYSESTNIDQIVQKRTRDSRNKSVYARDERGEIISNGVKKGVPLSDVWDIPYLNPKARERVGYPTQKPVLLLERIIELVTDEGDYVLDPFCGSGTTLIASKILDRRAVGIDLSQDAIDITNCRLADLVKTESALLVNGRSSYARQDADILCHLRGIDHFVIQRNKGIDAMLKQEVSGRPVFIRVQRPEESIHDAATALMQASRTKGPSELLLIVTNQNELALELDVPCNGNQVKLARSTSVSIEEVLNAHPGV